MIGTPRKGGTIDPKAEIVRSFCVRLSLTSGRGLSPTDSNYRKRLVSASEPDIVDVDHEKAFAGQGYKNLFGDGWDLDPGLLFGKAFLEHFRSIQRGSVVPQKAT